MQKPIQLQQLIHALELNDLTLSRTSSSGRADQSVSELKLPIKLTGQALVDSIQTNRARVAEFIIGAPSHAVKDSANLAASILTIANLTLSGTLPEGLFRTWPLPGDRTFGGGRRSANVAPSEIPIVLQQLCEELTSSPTSPVIERAALVEWSIGIGPLHPFYDGCGRISRCISALMLSAEGVPLKIHRERSSYFAAGVQGVDQFTKYYQSLEDQSFTV